MKLRLLDDSIRLRLSQSEVVTLEKKGIVETQTRFPGGSALKVALTASAVRAQFASADFADGRVVIGLEAKAISTWACDDSVVSIRREIELQDGGQLKLLVEKDFQCLTGRPDEDQSDLFQNPDSSAC